VESRDLYIVARVVQTYTSPDLTYAELSGMTEAKRTAVFAGGVLIQDVEDYDGDVLKAKAVARNLILPLPRTYSEAAEWCSRIRKGTRVYAMYPSTTSLYCATVIDCTTYCRGDDDIIVVEFDGDEDDFGKLPQRHIPARFVTLAPRQKKQHSSCPTNSPTRQTTSDSTQSTTSKPKKKTSRKQKTEKIDQHVEQDLSLNNLIDQMAYGDDTGLDAFDFSLDKTTPESSSLAPAPTVEQPQPQQPSKKKQGGQRAKRRETSTGSSSTSVLKEARRASRTSKNKHATSLPSSKPAGSLSLPLNQNASESNSKKGNGSTGTGASSYTSNRRSKKSNSEDAGAGKGSGTKRKGGLGSGERETGKKSRK